MSAVVGTVSVPQHCGHCDVPPAVPVAPPVAPPTLEEPPINVAPPVLAEPPLAEVPPVLVAPPFAVAPPTPDEAPPTVATVVVVVGVPPNDVAAPPVVLPPLPMVLLPPKATVCPPTLLPGTPAVAKPPAPELPPLLSEPLHAATASAKSEPAWSRYVLIVPQARFLLALREDRSRPCFASKNRAIVTKNRASGSIRKRSIDAIEPRNV